MGYLVITASPAVYTLQCAVPVVAPVNLGHTPVISNPDPTAATIFELTCTHTKICAFFANKKTLIWLAKR